MGLPARTRVVFGLLVVVLLASLAVYMHRPNEHGDLSLYDQYAWAFWTGPHAFRSLPAEYPLLAVIPFSLTVLPPLPDFISVFAAWMLLLLVTGLVVMARRESARVAEACAVSLGVGAFATVLGRYDLVPAAVTVLAYWAARERRFTAAYVLLAAGTLLKLYPALLVPVIAIEHARALGRDPRRSLPPRGVVAGVGLCAGLVAAGFALALVLDPAGWLGPFTYNSGRPVQIESLPGTLLWASGLAGFPVSPDRSFRSDNLVGALARPISLAAEAALALGLLWTWWRQACGRLDLARALAGGLLIVICTGRVLSPQYLIWVLPLVAIVEGGHDVLWLAVCVLTSLVFPFAYKLIPPAASGHPPDFPLLLLGLIAARNVLLVAATVRFLWSRRASAEPPPPAPAGSPVT